MDGISTIGSGTVAGALEYLEFLSSKGHMAPGAVSALKTGFRKVMETVGGAEWKVVDVRNIDLNEHMTRFGNMTHGKYNSKSLLDYRSRVNKVLTWYTEFLKNPGWTPNIKARTRIAPADKVKQKPTATTVTEDTAPVAVNSNNGTNSEVSAPQLQGRSNLVAFPFPLSDGTLASLYLPSIISASDARRMARFVESLVIEGTHTGQQTKPVEGEM